MKVRNTHIGAVAGIKAGQTGEATEAEVKRWPWALVPVEDPPAPARGPGRPPKAAQAPAEG
jgi:hypothetical protein